MKSKSYIFLIVLIFMIVFSLSAVSADDSQITSDTVSGDVDVVSANPFGGSSSDPTHSGELAYDIPLDVYVKKADVYVNVYSGSASNTYGAIANVSLNTTDGENQIASEELWIGEGSADGTIYPVNDHTTKCYSDYQMHYDITDSLKGLEGSSILLKVDTFPMEGKNFDGRIKLIALVVAYDDGDDDAITYFVDSTQRWTNSDTTTTFKTSDLITNGDAELINIALSNSDGAYSLNGVLLGDADNHTSGNYYQYNYWNVTDKIEEGNDTAFLSRAGQGAYGPSIKNVLTVLKVDVVKADATLATEYTSVYTCYAGTNNTLTIKTSSNKAGKYVIELLADGEVVNSTETEIDGETTILLTDPTVRDIDETTVAGANNTKVVYAVNIKYEDVIVGSANITVPVLYNGYLSKNFAYNASDAEFIDGFTFTGDIVFDIKGESSYKSGAADVNEIWTVEKENITNAYIYVPYNWFNPRYGNETADMFNAVFNDVALTPLFFYRDQANIGKYAKYGYGIIVYDVTDLIKTGDNTFNLTKLNATPTVYPTALVYGYDSPDKDAPLKAAYILYGADLLANDYNNAGRIVEKYTEIYVDPFIDATLYVMAAGAQKGEGNIIVDGKEFIDVWSGSSKTTDLFTTNITDIATGFNEITFVATGSTILTLPQIIVTTPKQVVVSAATEYANTCYAGTNNTLTVNLNSNANGTYLAELYADGFLVASTEVDLVADTPTTVYLTDPTIRDINETTVNGAENDEVEYEVIVKYDYAFVGANYLNVPVLYNGNLGYDLEYNVTGFEPYYTDYINGDVVVDVKDDSTYLAAGDMNRTDVWTVNLDEGCVIEDAFIFIPYNWFNPSLANETEEMFNLTFNGQTIVPVAYYRDQGNLGKYGKYGYGILIYRVYYLINASGDNTLVLNKKYATPAVYPSTLLYIYNNPKGSFKEISLLWGADLLSNANNKANRTAKSDTMIEIDTTDFVNATLYVLAAGAQKGEGNIIVNGNEFKDVWRGSSKTTDLFTADITDILAEENNISFVATGSTILALPQIIVADTGMVMSVDSIKTEYTSVPTCYAGTNNTLTVTVTNSKEGEFGFYLLANNHVVDELKVNLTNGTNTIVLTDPTIRDVDETTVNGADNNNVTYAVAMYYGPSFVYGDITVPILYNGNLGYDFEYNVTGFEYYNTYYINGDIVFDVKDDSTYLAAGDMNRTDVWTINLDENSEIDDAFIFIPYNWFNPSLANETEGMFDLTFNGAEIVPVAYYRDQGNLGKYGKYGYGILIYRVDNLINPSGNNTLVLNKKYATPAVYPSALLYTTITPGATCKEISLVWGADLLANSSNVANRTVKSDTVIGIDTTEFVNSTLYVLAAGAQKGEGNIIVNGNEFKDVWSGSSKTTNLFTADITDILAEENNISFVATGSTILALPQIIVADTGIVMSVDSIKTEYISVPTCYAGTNNTLTVTVTTNKDGEYELYLYSGLSQVASLKVNLTNGTHKLLMTDPTIRDIDETTVNGADNKNVSYSVAMFYEDYYSFNGIQVPLLYNGNLGKEYEYNATYIEDLTKYTVDGGIEVDIKPDSTYMNAAATNRTDVFLTDINFDLIKAFVYVPYNWDKTGVNGPVFNATFNGVTVTPKATYRDQSNLGKYGQYGYGLYVYDVTNLTGAENTFVLNKESGLTAVYPSAFIYLYNQTNSTVLYDIYMADGVDLLANSSNLAGRIVETDNIFDVDTEKVASAFLSVFAASAQAGEGDIRFNGILHENVWNGTSNSLNIYNILVPRSHVIEENEVSFVATGSTILALNQIYVTIEPKDKFPVFIDVNVTEATVGDNVTAYILTEGATGYVTVTSDIGPTQNIPLDEYGGAIYTIVNAPSGTHYVLVSYDGDEIYKSESVVALFDVAKLESNITITTPVDFEVGEEANVTVDIPGATGDVCIVIDGVENLVPLDNGTAVVAMNMTPGDHGIVAIYSGDAVYAPAVKTATVTAEILGTQFNNITIHKDLLISGVLVNSLGDVLNNTVVAYSVNGEKGTVVTGADGSFAIQGQPDAVVSIAYEGDDFYVGTNITINIENPLPTRIGTQFNVSSGYVVTSYAVEYSMGERGTWFDVRLTDENGNPISNETVQFGMNSVVMNMSTDANGVSSRQINYLKANTYTLAVCYLGNITHEASFIAVKVVVNKKPITISAASKTYKISAKTKKYTVTLKTIKNVNDGKTYLKAGKKVTMKINGKTYSAKIDSKGQATFNIKINKRGIFVASVKFAGDSTYEAASKTVKITIK